MGKYLSSETIQEAVQRLVNSRAKSGLVDFLVLKRALVRTSGNEVPFSSTDTAFTGAMGDLAGTYPSGSGHTLPAKFSPFVKVFGTAGADKYVTRKWLTNGPADTLSGPKWTSVVQIEGSKPRRGSIKTDHEQHLAALLLKAGSQLPGLTDAAIWYHRAVDLEARFGALSDSGKLEELLRSSFVEELGLTEDEIEALFDGNAQPLKERRLEEVLRAVAGDPQDYLPDLDSGSKELDQMLEEFSILANGDEVGLRLGRELLLPRGWEVRALLLRPRAHQPVHQLGVRIPTEEAAVTHVLTFCWAVILVFSYHDCRDRRPRKGVLVVHGFKGPVTNYITTYCDESVKITQHT